MPVRSPASTASTKITGKRVPVQQTDIQLTIPYADAVSLLAVLKGETVSSINAFFGSDAVGKVLKDVQGVLEDLRIDA